MSFWDRLTMKWRTRERAPEAEQARSLAQSISERADAITNHLKKYQRSRDPFAAMMADMYNRDQVSRIHRGNSE